MASLLELCCEEVGTLPLMLSGKTSTTPISDVTAESSSMSTNAPSKMCQKFNIQTPDKAALVMELVRDMKSPEKVPVRRQLLGGPNVTIQSLNNKIKKYIHVPRCIDDASANTALRKYKVVEIWETKTASVTPKLHDLWFEIQPQLTYLGRFYHFMEDPIENCTKLTNSWMPYTATCKIMSSGRKAKKKRSNR